MNTVRLNGIDTPNEGTDEFPCWTLENPFQAPGRVRNAQGKTLTGFKVKDTKKNRKVAVLFNGNKVHEYLYPIDAIAPKHTAINWLNTPMCGIPMMDSKARDLTCTDAIIQAVFANKKPVGDVCFYHSEPDQKAELIRKANQCGFEVLDYRLPHNAATNSFVMFGASALVKDYFDLLAISEFYAKALCLPYLAVRTALAKWENLTLIQALQTYPWADPTCPYEFMMTGMCLGYSFESTLAVIIRHFPAEVLGQPAVGCSNFVAE